MRTQKNQPVKPLKRVTTITLDPDCKILTVEVRVGENEEAESYYQTYNLQVVPFDLAMSQVCELLYPRNPQSYARK